MQRVPEPELMCDAKQAIAYANADFEEPHNYFIQLLKEKIGSNLPDTGIAVDLGCGAADISIRFVKEFSEYHVDALDGSEAMLAEGAKAVNTSGLSKQINLIQGLLQKTTLTQKKYDLIFSNSLLHHLHDPMILWRPIFAVKENTKIFIMDLMRPDNEEKLDWMVKEYSGDEPEILQRDFRNSLKAAFTPEEVNQQLNSCGLNDMTVDVVSDRHLIIYN